MSTQRFKHKRVAVLPARWNSSRFPGKPLAKILGKSLIQRSYENARRASSLDLVVVATEDERILEHVEGFGGVCVMTDPNCLNGSERVGETISRYFPEAEVIVNVQGDEPCLSPIVIETLLNKLDSDPYVQIATPIAVTTDPQEILTEKKVKCVFDRQGKALYFSRSPIPYVLKKESPFYLHIGVYAFRRNALFNYIESVPTNLSQAEDLEQLRILEHGGSIHVCLVNEKSPSVDYPEDINKVEEYLTCFSNASF
ncbi:3-deoxy-D-manno-octulosonate cytidylyltransferase [Chlamydia ibidis]|uniref:3-deoxy-manno-octulosonate cytidylyltransferase n=2 Tax=Chlamydia ibidis TaxID=1405396 RepID=S7KLK3_9CHLA|nr:3-deoxy-manno-octulosonate cytidylyltransferase [Chlamydia ibidis]EPP35300.1 3-deoxy-D-manno-octulosonate cytidylyltransferase [Chlamydia ibidis]EQM62786.1 3-deoxy-D-manno-octulosonate cytidylyltransferase [Chlamydia ibidis 10-1398/6]